MQYELPEGTWISYRYRGDVEYAKLCVIDGKQCMEIGLPPEVGETVHRCVWKKGDKLESRAVFTMTQELVDKVRYF